MEKVFAVGDIHGCYAKMVGLLDRIEINYKRDGLVFLGDYIDRGRESYEVVDYLIDLQKRFAHIIFLKGNHEAMLADFLAGRNQMDFLLNGGQQTLTSYLRHRTLNEENSMPPAHLAFFSSLQLYHETDDYIFVHAGLREGSPLAEQKEQDLLWIRSAFINSTFDFGKPVVFGHTPFIDPLVETNKIGIDTGAVYGNKLTCVELPAMRFYAV